MQTCSKERSALEGFACLQQDRVCGVPLGPCMWWVQNNSSCQVNDLRACLAGPVYMECKRGRSAQLANQSLFNRSWLCSLQSFHTG